MKKTPEVIKVAPYSLIFRCNLCGMAYPIHASGCNNMSYKPPQTLQKCKTVRNTLDWISGLDTKDPWMLWVIRQIKHILKHGEPDLKDHPVKS